MNYESKHLEIITETGFIVSTPLIDGLLAPSQPKEYVSLLENIIFGFRRRHYKQLIQGLRKAMRIETLKYRIVTNNEYGIRRTKWGIIT